jgi:hypothetical protein
MQKDRVDPVKKCIGKKLFFSLIIQVGSNFSIIYSEGFVLIIGNI